MAHKRQIEGTQVKTYSFKVKNVINHDVEFILNGIKEFHNYYNTVSDWICKNLLDTKIGDLAKYFDESQYGTAYYDALQSKEWCNMPLYYIFTKKFSSNNRNNILYNAINKLNVDNYNGNVFGISDTYYRRSGYMQSVISNYVTKFSKFGIKNLKYKALPDNPNDEELLLQTLYDSKKFNLNKQADWEERINYFEMKGECVEKHLKRTRILYDYFKNNEEKINKQKEELSVKELINFGGCRRKEDKQSMTIQYLKKSPYVVKVNENGDGYILTTPKNTFVFNLNGRYDTLSHGVDFANVSTKHCDSLTIKIVKGEVFVDIPVDTNFTSIENSGDKIVGIDVNTKHMLMMTSLIDDSNLKEYVNIYKEAINDSDFVKECPQQLLKQYQDIAQYVTFGPIESNLLVSRNCKTYEWDDFDGLSGVEMAFSNVIKKLKYKFIKNGDNFNRIYIENIITLRNRINSYARLKNKYYKEQAIFDIEQDYIDESTKSKETMDKRRYENPFINTKIAQELIGKMNNIQQDINGCTKNIINYAYKIFEKNEYDTICLEKLDSSNFEKTKNMPTTTSLMKYHKVEGKTIEEASALNVYSVIKKDYYIFNFNEENKINGCTLSPKGEYYKFKNDFFNLVLKTVHFAEVKDYFITLQNNGNVNVVLVPCQYTSQMDSINHVLYTEKTKNQKETLVDKKVVRKTQEQHINGLNADFNAAMNIKYSFENTTWREALLNKNELKYNTPLWDTKIKSKGGIIAKLKSKKINAFMNIDDVDFKCENVE